jgi:hypothetical protein
VIIIAAAYLAAAPAIQDQLAACRAAVHGDLASAAKACAVADKPIDILSPDDGMSAACAAALAAGQKAGRFGPGVPAPMRAGLIRDYDARDRACLADKPEPTTKTREIIQIWD